MIGACVKRAREHAQNYFWRTLVERPAHDTHDSRNETGTTHTHKHKHNSRDTTQSVFG